MVKKNTSVWIEEEYLEELKNNNLKVSELINNYLKTYVEILKSSQNALFDERKKIMDTIKSDKITLDLINKRILELIDDSENE